MKTSNRILLLGLAAILVLITGTVVTARVTLNRIAEQVGEIELSGNIIEREYGITGFHSLRIDGAWRVTVTEGGEYAVTVRGDRAVVDLMTVDLSGSELVFGTRQGAAVISKDLEANVTMPSLEALRVRGGTDMRIRGFDLERLALRSEGAARIDADGLSVRELKIISAGAADIELGNARVRSANVNMEGASNVRLHMTGGSLTGRLQGVGILKYSGTIESESVIVEGIGSVEHTGAEAGFR